MSRGMRHVTAFYRWCCQGITQALRRYFGTTGQEVEERVEEEEKLREERRLRLEEARKREEALSRALPEADQRAVREIRRRLRTQRMQHGGHG